jgi:hypothetical protein
MVESELCNRKRFLSLPITTDGLLLIKAADLGVGQLQTFPTVSGRIVKETRGGLEAPPF